MTRSINGADTIPDLLSSHTAQLASITNKLENFTYNLNALQVIKRKRYWSAISIGDSIAAGTAAANNNGFLQHLNTALNWVQGHVNFFPLSFSDSTWTAENVGICKNLISYKAGSATLQGFPYAWVTPQADYKIKVVYSKRTDGGTFQVGYGSTVLDTINCNGATQDGVISAEYTIPKGNTFLITPMAGQKAYINLVQVRLNTSLSHFEYENWAVGGRKAKDYADSDLQTMINYNSNDLLIWELITNDYGGGDYASYVDRTETVMTAARNKNMDILIVIPNGQGGTDTDPNWRGQWVQYLYNTADKYNAALIDYDKFLGGYNNAKATGIIADTVHPTSDGHVLMADVIIRILLGMSNPQYYGLGVDTSDTRLSTYGKHQDTNVTRFTNTFVMDSPYVKGSDQNGNAIYTPAMPNNGFGIWDPTMLPKNANTGELAYFGNGYIYGRNGSNWIKLYTQVITEVMTSLPTAQAGYRGHVITVDGGGTADDKLYICIEQAGGTYAWKQVTLT